MHALQNPFGCVPHCFKSQSKLLGDQFKERSVFAVGAIEDWRRAQRGVHDNAAATRIAIGGPEMNPRGSGWQIDLPYASIGLDHGGHEEIAAVTELRLDASALLVVFIVQEQRTLQREAGLDGLIAQVGDVGSKSSMDAAHANEVGEHTGIAIQL